MRDLFVCEDLAMRQSDIRKVALLEGGGCITNMNRKPADHMYFMPRVVINDNHIFELEQGLRALEQLFVCGYFTLEQKNQMSTKFQTYIDSFALIFPSETIAS